MAEFKYTDEELDNLIKWFDGRELPESMHLDKATFIPDTRKAVESLIIIAKEKRVPTFQPTIEKLFRIKEIIEGKNS